MASIVLFSTAAKKQKANISRAFAPIEEGSQKLRQWIEKIGYDSAQREWASPIEAKVRRIAQQRVQKSGGSLDEAKANLGLERRELYVEFVRARGQQIQFNDIRRQKDHKEGN